MDSIHTNQSCGSSSISKIQDFLHRLNQQQQQKEIINLVVETTTTTNPENTMVSPLGRRDTDASGMNVNAATASNGNAKVNAHAQINVNNGHTQLPVRRRKVAVIGGGVSGLSAAWHLSQQARETMEVTVFESEPRLGGHASTVPVPLPNGKTVEVDVGFMVYNETNYPNMVQWFTALNNNNVEEVIDAADDVLSENTEMSLSVSLDEGQTLEWTSLGGLNGLFAKRSQLLSGNFYTMLRDMNRFHHEAPKLLLLHDEDPRKHIPTRDYLRQQGYSTAFATYYLLPMMAALWSASMTNVLQFPISQLVGFLCNHQMLQVFARPQWKTVKGRSHTYTKRVAEILGEKNVRLSTPIVSMKKIGWGVYDDGTEQRKQYELFTSPRSDNNQSAVSVGVYDELIFACHTDTAASILQHNISDTDTTSIKVENPTCSSHRTIDPSLIATLLQIEYANNVVYLHSDANLMPQRKRAWASWNCLGNSQQIHTALGVGGGKIGSSSSSSNSNSTGRSETGAFEGAESGFGNTATATTTSSSSSSYSSSSNRSDMEHNDTTTPDEDTLLEGKEGRMKAVYVTYWLNKLQNLETTTTSSDSKEEETNIFVSLNPHCTPDPTVTYQRTHFSHPQFTPTTLKARKTLQAKYQGTQGLWFCGAYLGYGFHEDGCRSGFEVATTLSGISLPWVPTTTVSTKLQSEPKTTKKKRRSIMKKHNDHCCSSPTTTTTNTMQPMVLPPPNLAVSSTKANQSTVAWLYKKVSYDLPVVICETLMVFFLRKAVVAGKLRLKFNDSTVLEFGDGSSCGLGDDQPVTIRVFDPWLFVKLAWENDLGLARSYMAGYFIVEPLDDPTTYNPVLRPPQDPLSEETTLVCGDPVGLTRLLLLLMGNRDRSVTKGAHVPKTSYQGYALSGINGGLVFSKIGSFLNYIRYKFTMDNSEKGGSLKNIHAHYDLSNDLFKSFLDPETLMYSSAIYDAVAAPSPQRGLVFRGTLEEAQWRKLDTLLDRAQVQPGQMILDIGFGWGGLSLHAAKKYGCTVVGITLSVEQRDLALERVKEQGLEDLITFEVIDYRTFARRPSNGGKFDRVLSCEMIEAVGHAHLTEFFWAVEQVLTLDGVLVMEAITTTEERYEQYLKSTDFINTIIFPGSCCPCLHALVDAAYQGSRLTLEHIDNIGLHYAQTLADWRRRFNAKANFVSGELGFDDIFVRAWNYYLCYCEAGFYARNVNCLILVFARNGCSSLTPMYETRACTQLPALTTQEVSNWMSEA